MSKRPIPTNATSTPSRPTKRRGQLLRIGAPTADDAAGNRQRTNVISSTSFSERKIHQPSPPALVTLCARVFTDHFRQLSGEDHWLDTREWLKILPEPMVPKLFSMLKAAHPKLLSHAVITSYFFRGQSVFLDGEIGLTNDTVSALPRVLGKKLQILHLTDCERYSDAVFASVVSKLPVLEVINFRNCSKVGPKAVEALANSCPNLRVLNLSSTSITPVSLNRLAKSCRKLEVLKLASIQSFTDTSMSKLFALIAEDNWKDKGVFPNLRSLKLRHNPLSDASISTFLDYCRNLARLDISFTLCRHPAVPLVDFHQGLEKLSLTSTSIHGKDVVHIVSRLPKLKILALGALGSGPNASSNSAMTLNDDYLRELTDALQGCPDLEKVNLVQNSKLGMTKSHDGALAYFVRLVGRRCKYLNLSSIPRLSSADLAGLLPDNDQAPSPLQTLILNKTDIDDDAAHFIASCAHLGTLELAETKMTAEGLFMIIDACDRLARLNVTGCRGVSVADRRRFFEAWERERGET